MGALTLEQQYLIGILCDFLDKKNSQKNEEIDYEELIRLSKSSQVSSIVFKQCGKFLPDEIRKTYAEITSKTIYLFANRQNQFARISEALRNENIAFFTVKGFELAKCYPIPALRTMSDCDIVVHTADKQRAHDVLVGMGCENREHLDYEWTYFKNGFEYELHDKLIYKNTNTSTKLCYEFCDKTWDYVEKDSDGNYLLNHNFHLVFLLIHIKKHLLYEGVGIRQFIDLLLAYKSWNIDFEWVKETLQKLDLYDFANTCFAFIQRWFGFENPYGGVVDDEFFVTATQKILNGGVFGHNEVENRENGILNDVRKKGKFGYYLHQIFPSYSDVKYVEHYSFVKGRPYLLPAVWVYRIFRNKKITKQKMQKIDTLYDKKDERSNYLKNWGL